MPFNLLKKYNQLLDIAFLEEKARMKSLYGIFSRDIEENPTLNFKGKKINPIKGKEPEMQNLFRHLTTVIVDEKTRKRVFEMKRSERLHWVKFHLEEQKKEKMLVFSVQDTDGIRTYILDEDEKYVIVLAPDRTGKEYYLLTAYLLEGRNMDKIKKKYARKLPDLY